jgi:hypothetical protein
MLRYWDELGGLISLLLGGGELPELTLVSLDEAAPELLSVPEELSPLDSEPLDDGSPDPDELGADDEGPLDDGALLLGALEELLPEELPLEGPLELLEQHSQQQQPAWWLKLQAPSWRVSVAPDRQIDTARE